jgi:hypothetical protein
VIRLRNYFPFDAGEEPLGRREREFFSRAFLGGYLFFNEWVEGLFPLTTHVTERTAVYANATLVCIQKHFREKFRYLRAKL